MDELPGLSMAPNAWSIKGHQVLSYPALPHFTPILSCNRESLEQLENRDQLAPRYVHVSPRVTQHNIAPPWGHRVKQLAPKVFRGRACWPLIGGIAAMTGLSLLQVSLVQHSHMELNSRASSESMWNPLTGSPSCCSGATCV